MNVLVAGMEEVWPSHPLADGDFVQWIENGRLHVRIAYHGRSRRVVETAVFRQRPQLAQESWSLRETQGNALQRLFEVNLASGAARARKREGAEMKDWSEQIDVEPGRTFAGFGFTLAAKALRSRLVRGERVELHAVGFTPKPRAVTVELSYGGRERMRMADRVLGAERFDVHPKLPWIADLFMNVPDAHIWLSQPPAVFLRFEGPMAEPADPITRVDLLPGGSSGPATPVATSGRK
jgi:hypothetical protein